MSLLTQPLHDMWRLHEKQMKNCGPIYFTPGEKEQASDSVKPTASLEMEGFCSIWSFKKCSGFILTTLITNSPFLLKYILKIICNPLQY